MILWEKENILNDIISKKNSIAVIGLGYVGLPLALAFAKKFKVIGYDYNKSKIQDYKAGKDYTKTFNEELKNSSILFTSDSNKLKEAKFFIIAVPTPLNKDKTPDLSLVENATKTVANNMSKGSIIVYESTVYPGVTQDICLPILENVSHLKCGGDFKIGYSPERINPGDKIHRLENIVKVVSGCDDVALDIIEYIYKQIITAGIYRASGIKIAEAAKIIENCQRDINIAFMNELSIIFSKMNIDTLEVLKASQTKWNFLNFYPGLVGGHCIGVDPYYLTYKAEELGYHSQIILSGRKINDDMGKYIAQNVIKKLLMYDLDVSYAKVAILGFTFKENCPDIRNTKVIDIIKELKEYSLNPIVYDPIADLNNFSNNNNINFVSSNDLNNLDALIIAVGHDEFKKLSVLEIKAMFNSKNSKKLLFDIKGILNKEDFNEEYIFWRL